MEKIRRILAPTDLSDLSRTGVRHALEMGRSLGAEVIVYHVISYEKVNLPHEGFYTESLPKKAKKQPRLDFAARKILTVETNCGILHA